jgi:hypothetical protein
MVDQDAAKLIKRLGAQHVQACFKHECELDAMIEAAEDGGELDAIDVNLGWPA